MGGLVFLETCEFCFYDVEEGFGAEDAASGCDVTALVAEELEGVEDSVGEAGLSVGGPISLSIS